jgi:hypothetical protein
MAGVYRKLLTLAIETAAPGGEQTRSPISARCHPNSTWRSKSWSRRASSRGKEHSTNELETGVVRFEFYNNAASPNAVSPHGLPDVGKPNP